MAWSLLFHPSLSMVLAEREDTDKEDKRERKKT
jgi:hypothetical protein